MKVSFEGRPGYGPDGFQRSANLVTALTYMFKWISFNINISQVIHARSDSVSCK